MNSIIAFLLLCIPARILIAMGSQFVPDAYLNLYAVFLLITGYIHYNALKKWYRTYNLSAVIADVFIIIIGLIITRAIYYYIFDSFSIVKFILLAVIVQIIHDILFYILFLTCYLLFEFTFDFTFD
jgi:hypothetical protein